MEELSVDNIALTDDAIAEMCVGGRRPNTRSESRNSRSRSRQSRLASGVCRRIDVAPATGSDVTQSPEPPIQCSWKPMRPGYASNVDANAVLIERTVRVEDFDKDDNDNSFRSAIPIMSRSVALVCAVCNIITPGLGQIHTVRLCIFYYMLLYKLSGPG